MEIVFYVGSRYHQKVQYFQYRKNRTSLCRSQITSTRRLVDGYLLVMAFHILLLMSIIYFAWKLIFKIRITVCQFPCTKCKCSIKLKFRSIAYSKFYRPTYVSLEWNKKDNFSMLSITYSVHIVGVFMNTFIGKSEKRLLEKILTKLSILHKDGWTFLFNPKVCTSTWNVTTEVMRFSEINKLKVPVIFFLASSPKMACFSFSYDSIMVNELLLKMQ